ncbi:MULTISPECIES: MFS transporter [unclassified Novosphingobium]|uniref:MFS transporter n=1 Tax=unclassified Novosphingobium TaxID=2644732 RepID=UPI00146E3A01|nr:MULTISPECIES: MFS transporter [unclassified Novosphingobium]NMN06673.1 MFS family permease [Novosphingobium sp. SG919]NMN88876.1 MFS family permease [Novosphingobium sp. SG916]
MPASHARQATQVAIAATIANTLCMTAAISATIGVFLVPIAQDFGWPRAGVSGVLGLISVISAISYPLIGRAMDRFGARWLLLVGNLGLAAGILLVSRASGTMLDFYWRFAVVGLFGTMAATGMVSKVVSNWFDARRGLMLGVTAGVGNGVGATIMPIVAGLVLTSHGWRAGYATIGVIVALAAPFIALWLRDAPPAVQGAPAAPLASGMSLGQAMRTSAFWLMLLAVAAGAGGMTAMFTHVVPILTGHGVGLAQATGVVAVFALVTAGWQVVTGGLLDRFRTPRLLLPMYASAMIGMVVLQFYTGSLAIILAGALLGIGMGAEYAALSYFVSRYFGLRHFGTIVGAFYAVVAFIQGVAPMLMDMSFDRTGSYAGATLTIVGALAAGMVLLALLPHPDRFAQGQGRRADDVTPGDLVLA